LRIDRARVLLRLGDDITKAQSLLGVRAVVAESYCRTLSVAPLSGHEADRDRPTGCGARVTRLR
jgi:hypothetical protein